MKRSEAARYARWSAAIALVLASLTVAVYLKRDWLAHLEGKNAPPSAAGNVERQSNGLTFSKVEGDKKIFTVEASKATEFKDQNASLLEEVKITIFGKSGERHDVMRTRSCQYGKSDGTIFCSGDVIIDLLSAAEFQRLKENPQLAADAETVHVETRGVKFDRARGLAQTDQPVAFTFREGKGSAVGVEYESAEGTVKLLHNVQLALKQTGNARTKHAALKAGEEIHVTGASLDFSRDTRKMRLVGPAEAKSASAQLRSGEITLELDDDFRAKTLIAASGSNHQRPEMIFSAPAAPFSLTANTLIAVFSPDGWVNKITASGNVFGSRRDPRAPGEFRAETAFLDMWPEVNRPKQCALSGNVFVKAQGGSATTQRTLQTSAVRVNFSKGNEDAPGRPTRAETLASGTLGWNDATGVAELGEGLDGEQPRRRGRRGPA